MRPDFRAALADLAIRLEHVHGLNAFEQLRHLWPVVHQLMDALRLVGEELERIKDQMEGKA